MVWRLADRLAKADPVADLEYTIRTRVAMALGLASAVSGVGVEASVIFSSAASTLNLLGFIIAASAIVVTGAGLYLRRPGVTLAVLFSIILAGIAYAAWLNRGIYAPALIFIPGVVLAVYYVFGLRATAAVGVFLAGLLGWVVWMSREFSFDQARVDIENVVMLMALETALVSGVIVLVGTTFRSAIREASTQLEASHERVRDALEAARAANEAKTQFLANIGHEFRTPMNGVLGMVDALKNDPEFPAQYRMQLAIMEESGRDLLGLLTNVLEFVTADQALAARKLHSLSLNELVTNAARNWQISAMEKGVEMEITCAQVISDRILSNPDTLVRALDNIVCNAVKFTDRGRIRISCEQSETGTDDQLETRICVTDTGTGITTEQLGTIFTPFHQADSSNTRRYGGTGIGLATSRKLVREMGGEIDVRSTPGIGSRFTIRFLADIQPEPDRETPDSPRTAAPEQGETCRVLVVDDVPTNRIVLQSLLNLSRHARHFEIEQADSGRCAVQMAQDRQYDLILMDIQMPEMDGITALKTLQRLPRYMSIPVVAVTARALDSDRDALLKEGFSAYLAKPVNLADLDAVLDAQVFAATPAEIDNHSTAGWPSVCPLQNTGCAD